MSAPTANQSFTVVGYHENTGIIESEKHQAKDTTEAMLLAARSRLEKGDDDYVLVCAMLSPEDIQFPGDSPVEVADFVALFEDGFEGHDLDK